MKTGPTAPRSSCSWLARSRLRAGRSPLQMGRGRRLRRDAARLASRAVVVLDANAVSPSLYRRDHGTDRDNRGHVSHLDRADVDTDQIMPKQFLKRVERTGFGEFLFYDWAKEPGWDLPRQPDPRRRRELRLRLLARARAVGAAGLRLPGDRRAVASPTSSTPTAPRSGCCRSCSHDEDCRALARAGARRRSTCASRRSASPGAQVAFEIDHEIRHRLLGGPRRHRADARSRTTRSPTSSASASAAGRVTTAL